MIKIRLRGLATLATLVLMTGCGNLGVDSSYVDQARSNAQNPNLTAVERSRIFEDAGDTAVARGRRGFADEMYFEAALALAYGSGNENQRQGGLQRLNQKCVSIGMVGGPGCQEIPNLLRERQAAAGGSRSQQAGTSQALVVPGRSDAATGRGPGGAPNGSAGANSPAMPDIDEAIRQARAKRTTRPAMIDGCPTNIDHLATELPVCPANRALTQLRELILLTDASFIEDQAAGYSLRQIATNQAQAARQYEDALRTAETSMLEASASGELARSRLSALRETPPRCDAGPQGSFGMGESAYQAYVNAFMVAKASRAVSAAAACRARARP